MNRWKRTIFEFAPLLLLASLGIILILVQTRFGPGASGDSVHYIMGARNLIAGNGYSRTSGGGEIRPITGFPPLFSIVLAGVGLTGIDLFIGASILNAFLFGANIFLVGFLIYRYTHSKWASIIGCLFIITSDNLLSLHGWVMSEALYIFLMLLAFLALVEYLDRYKAFLLIIAGVAASLATLSRLVGVSFIAAGGLAILLLSNSGWKRRLAEGASFGLVAVAPVVIWLGQISTSTGTLANRELIYHPLRYELIRSYIAEVVSWFVPRSLGLSRPLRAVLVALLAIPGPLIFSIQSLRLGRLRREDQQKVYRTLPWVLILYVTSFIAVLLVNSLLLDAGTTLSAPARYLVPVFVTAVIFFSIVINQVLKTVEGLSIVRYAVVLILGSLLLLYSIPTVSNLANPLPTIGYTGLRELWPDTVLGLQDIDSEVPIISNNPEMIYILADRPAYMWPIIFDSYRLQNREDFDQQIAATQEKLNRGGVLVIIGWPEEASMIVNGLLETERLIGYMNSAFFGYSQNLTN